MEEELFETTLFRDFENVISSNKGRSKLVNIWVKIVSPPEETKGGRTDWMVEDAEDESFRAFMVCFKPEVDGFYDLLQTNHTYIILNARLEKDEYRRHYPYRIVLSKRTRVLIDENDEVFHHPDFYNFRPFSEVVPGVNFTNAL